MKNEESETVEGIKPADEEIIRILREKKKKTNTIKQALTKENNTKTSEEKNFSKPSSVEEISSKE